MDSLACLRAPPRDPGRLRPEEPSPRRAVWGGGFTGDDLVWKTACVTLHKVMTSLGCSLLILTAEPRLMLRTRQCNYTSWGPQWGSQNPGSALLLQLGQGLQFWERSGKWGRGDRHHPGHTQWPMAQQQSNKIRGIEAERKPFGLK